MAKNGFKVFDSDMHVMDPPDLWERYIDNKFKARAPRGVTSSNVRDLRMIYPDGRDWGAHDNPPKRFRSGPELRTKPRGLSSRRRAGLDSRGAARSDGHRRY